VLLHFEFEDDGDHGSGGCISSFSKKSNSNYNEKSSPSFIRPTSANGNVGSAAHLDSHKDEKDTQLIPRALVKQYLIKLLHHIFFNDDIFDYDFITYTPFFSRIFFAPFTER